MSLTDSIMDGEVKVPEPLMRQFSKQIAGHSVEKGSSKPGMMKHADGSLLKPILSPPRGPRELDFYKRVFEESEKEETDDIHLVLKSLLPAFRGVFWNESNTQGFMKLEDLTENFNRPCILDVKMGARTYDLEASEQKILREQQKYKETKTFGFCIPGMQVYNLKTQKYICKGKDYGKKLNKETMLNAFRLYFNSDTGMSSNVIKSFLLHLNKVRQWFLMQSNYVFFASSLLLIYDADSLLNCAGDCSSVTLDSNGPTCHCRYDNPCEPDWDHACPGLNKLDSGVVTVKEKSAVRQPTKESAKANTHREMNIYCENGTCSKKPDLNSSMASFEIGDGRLPPIENLTVVRMIDFAHVFQSTEKDENYLQGLNTVIRLLEDLLREAK